MITRISALLILLIFSIHLFAQHDQCGTMENLEEQMKNDPLLKLKMEQTESRINHFLTHQTNHRGAGTILTIPVVFHIVHNGEPVGSGANISDSQVISQLLIMNEDFRRLNADTTNTPPYFLPFAADSEIEFCMATIDPQGMPTNGIDRIDGGQATWSSTNDINTNLKPVTVWNSANYLNFWTVNFGNSSLLGYAQFPGGNALTDGIVCGHEFIGRPPYNPFTNNYNLGRTATHEIGHWLDLRHIWGDGNCSVDDNVNDTPLAASSNRGCDTSTNSCVDTPVDYKDMVQNYMDYTHDDCMNIFTIGQSDRMRAAIMTTRASLLTSPGCSNLTAFSYSGKIVDSLTGIGIPYSKARFKSLNFNFETDADTNGNFTFPNFFEGTYDVLGGQWGYMTKLFSNESIDTLSANFIIKLTEAYYDDFALDFEWVETSTSSSGVWERGNPAGTFFGGIPSNPGDDIATDFADECQMTGNGGGGAGNDDVDNGYTILSSPYFDVTNFSDPYIQYYRWFFNDGGNGTPDDRLIVSITDGTNTDTLENIDVNDPNQSSWFPKKFRISDYLIPTDSMQIIIYTSDLAGSGHLVEAAIDVFRVTDSLPSVTLPIAGFDVSDTVICEGESVQFTDMSINQPVSHKWTFQGGNPTASTQKNPSVNYDNPGLFPVKLVVTNLGGDDSLIISNYILVNENPVIGLTYTDVMCFDSSDGSLQLQITGGQTPYHFLWNTGDTTQDLNGLPVGSYAITVTDFNGCQSNTSKFISQPGRITTTAIITPNVFADSSDGQVEISAVGGGTPPYTYQWDDSLNQTTATAINLPSDTIRLVVTDANGCMSKFVYYVSTTFVPFVDGNDFNKVSIFPNPTTGILNLEMELKSTAEIDIIITDILGREILSEQYARNSRISSQIDLSKHSNGIYLMRIRSGEDERVYKIQLSK